MAYVECKLVVRDADRDAAPISGPEQAGKAFASIGDKPVETFSILLLDARNGVIGGRARVVSVGTLNASLVHPREVFKLAIWNNAASIIIGHSHPSGDASPSKEDVELTHRLGKAGALLGIGVLDHIIVAPGGRFTSLKSRGLMKDYEYKGD